MKLKMLIVFIGLMLVYSTISLAKIQTEEIHQMEKTVESDLKIESIKGGLGLSASLRNNGDKNLSNINWTFNIQNGLVLKARNISGTISLLRPDDNEIITTPILIGFGEIIIQLTVWFNGNQSIEKTVRGRLFGFFIQIYSGDYDALTAELELIASGFKSPTVLTNAGDNTNRLFIADLPGKIYIVENGSLLSTPFLDISDKIVTLNPIYDERGLLGFTFHPQYEVNGRFFVYYSAPKTDSSIDHQSIIAEYQVSDNPNVADTSSEQIILTVDQPEGNHNGGQLAFGSDGYLYIGLGDGGGAGDQHGTIGNGQDINTSLGAILRIDIDTGTPYSIPPDNPFVGVDGLDEIYAFGFRNPYRFSFDNHTGNLFVADVGQDEWEEIDIVEKGGNYGWRILEGTHAYDLNLADILGLSLEDLESPIHEYSHEVGRSIIGGFMYRGTEYPELQGKYIFGDWSTNFVLPRGKLYYLEEIKPETWKRLEFNLQDTRILRRFILGFGQDQQGELYVLTTRTPGSLLSSGEIYQLKIK